MLRNSFEITPVEDNFPITFPITSVTVTESNFEILHKPKSQ